MKEIEDTSIEIMNDELAEEAKEQIEVTKPVPKETKKNSKRDIVKRIFEICEKYNFELTETEQQLNRKTRKKLLEMLASFVEQSIELKVKSGQNGVPPDCQSSSYVAQLPILRLCHGFFASLVEKGVNGGMSYFEYSYELRNYAKTCQDSLMIDQCLLDIAEDMGDDILGYISNPYCRLAFVHMTSIMSCVSYVDRNRMKSPRFNVNNI